MNIFPRPKPNPRSGAPTRPRSAIRQPATPGGSWLQPWPRIDATLALVAGLVLTAVAVASGGQTAFPSEVAKTAAMGVGASLAVSFLLEARSGLQNLVRADLMGILALYYLTLYEFIFPQPFFNHDARYPDSVRRAVWAVILGMGCIAVGRHFIRRGRQPFEHIMTRVTPAPLLVGLFWVSFGLGYLHMLLGVNFDLVLLVDYMTQPRFMQPWGRGKFGDWKALINELALLLYFIPPLMGLMLARKERFSWIVLATCMLGFLWTLFYGFASGTRNLFGAFLVTFMIAYAMASPAERRKQVVVVCALCAGALALSTRAMLDMRTVGFQRWWKGEFEVIVNRQSEAVFVDDNLLTITRITEYFPKQHDFLGMEIPYLAIVRPIPRAIWKGKPEGLSVSVEEDIFNMKGLTMSSTFIGEGYMTGGFPAVALFGLGLGALAGLWNRMASPRSSELGILVFASGFFAVVITMRSVMTLTTALLTPAAGIFAGAILLKGAKRVLGGRKPLPRPIPKRPPPK